MSECDCSNRMKKLKESGLIGCLNDTDITSSNYKNANSLGPDHLMVKANMIERTKRSIKRAGSHMPHIMNKAVVEGKLSGEDALSLFNTYGIGLDIILLIAHSHGIDVCETRFEYLKQYQEERMKNSKQC